MEDTDKHESTQKACLERHDPDVKKHKKIELDIQHCNLMFNNGYVKNYVRPGKNI